MPNRNSVDWQQFLEWEVKLVKAYPESWQLNRGNKDVRLWAGWKSKSDSDQNALSGLWICHIPSLMAAAKKMFRQMADIVVGMSAIESLKEDIW